MWKFKVIKNAKSVLNKNNKEKEIILHNSKIYHLIIAIK